MDNLIQLLKENEKPFGLMSKEMQEELATITSHDGVSNIEWYDDDAQWRPIANNDWFGRTTYRLRPDYKEEPEVMKMEIYKVDGYLMYNLPSPPHPTSCRDYLYKASSDPDFIGFLYEDGMVEPISRRYKFQHGGIGVRVQEANISAVKILTPTHVLFRKSDKE